MPSFKTNAALVKAWAEQSHSEGYNFNESLFFKGRAIYSYRYSWPLAILPRTPSHKARVNADYISPATARHATLVRKVLGELKPHLRTCERRYIPLPREELARYIRKELIIHGR